MFAIKTQSKSRCQSGSGRPALLLLIAGTAAGVFWWTHIEQHTTEPVHSVTAHAPPPPETPRASPLADTSLPSESAGPAPLASAAAPATPSSPIAGTAAVSPSPASAPVPHPPSPARTAARGPTAAAPVSAPGPQPFIAPTREQIRDQPASVTAAQILSQRLNLSDPAVEKEVTRLLTESYETRKRAAWEKAKQMGLETKGVKAGGGSFELQDFEDGRPVYLSTNNVNAAISTNTHEVREKLAYHEVDGSGMTIGVWDSPGVRTSHQEFKDVLGNSRVTIRDGSSGSRSHPTHVTGTIAAAGWNPVVKGMAPAVSVDFYDSNNDLAEMVGAGSSLPGDGKLLVSSGSYGPALGWETIGAAYYWFGTFIHDGVAGNDVEHRFGQYNSRAAALDGLAYNKPYFLMVRSAGNDRSNGPPPPGTDWIDAATGDIYASYFPPLSRAVHMPPADGVYAAGFDCLLGEMTAKNVLTVGAVTDAVNDFAARNIGKAGWTDFTSWGPADDGRIKPDIVANGHRVLSTSNRSDRDVASLNGTSMATPNVAGSAILLQQYYAVSNPEGQPMRADMLKGLIIHTADDLGPIGPDYQFGWGLMNTKAAADVIKAHFDNMNGAAVYTGQMTTTSAARTYQFGWDSETLRATLCWTDPPAAAQNAHNDSNPDLVNDLDLSIIGPDGTHFLPFVLSPENGTTSGINHRDNVEQVVVSTFDAEPGIYTIVVHHTGTLTHGLQDYALVISGNKAPPDIAVEVDDVQPLVSKSSRVDFGYLPVGESSTHTFTIRNVAPPSSLASLTGLVVSKGASDPAEFVITQPAASTLAPSAETTFKVTFTASGPGLSTATLRIASNDPEDNPFEITLTGMSPVNGNVGEGWVTPNSTASMVAFDKAGNVITGSGAKFAHADGSPLWQISPQPDYFIGVDSDNHVHGFRTGVGLVKFDGATGVEIAGPHDLVKPIIGPLFGQSFRDSSGAWFRLGSISFGGDRFYMIKYPATTFRYFWEHYHEAPDILYDASQRPVVDAQGNPACTYLTLDNTDDPVLTKVFLVKLSGATGALSWETKIYEGSHASDFSNPVWSGADPPQHLLTDGSGNILYATTRRHAGVPGAVVSINKYSGANGALIWSIDCFEAVTSDPRYTKAAVLDEDGNLLVTHAGITEKRSGTSGALIWHSVLPFYSKLIAYGVGGHVAVGGYKALPDTESTSYFTVKLDHTSGAMAWTRSHDLPPGSSGQPTFIAADSQGNVAIRGPNATIVYPVAGSTLTLTRDHATRLVDEGKIAENTGTFSSTWGNGTVTLTATKGGAPFGSITKDNAAGTWKWSRETTDGPEDGGTVTITATDGGVPVTTDFALTVNNLAPLFDAGPDVVLTLPEAATFSRGPITFTDPSLDVWSGTVNFDDNTGDQPLTVNQAAKSFSLSHAFTAPGGYFVTVTLRDGDVGGAATDIFKVTVPRFLDDWRLLHFGTAENAGKAANTADIDVDGLDNLAEYALGLDPKESSIRQYPQPERIDDTVTLTVNQPDEVTGVTYGARCSTNLISWDAVPDTGTGNTHIFSVNAAGTQKMFVRLVFTSP